MLTPISTFYACLWVFESTPQQMFKSFGLFSLLIAINLFNTVLTNHVNGFQCRNGSFVPLDNLCDFTDQCRDNSDESQCSLYETCDFETDLCNMTSEGWIRTKGFTNRSPRHDHKLNNSAYFLKLSSHSMLPAQAVLRSVVFYPTDERMSCQLRFYYHFADIIGTLMVGLQDQVNDIWKQTSSQKNEWTREVITIHSAEKFKIVIQGTIFERTGSSGAIAIDDVSFSGGCSVATDEVSLCDSVMCDWTPRTTEGQVSWMLESDFKKTTLYPEFANKINGNVKDPVIFAGVKSDTSQESAFLDSPWYNDTHQACQIEFYYLIEENNNLRLLLYSEEIEEVLFQQNKSTEGQWYKGEIRLQNISKRFKLVFEGRIKDSRGFIALDDVRVGSAKLFTPAREICLSAQSVCDFEKDCSNGVDEDPAYCRNFSRCDFETNCWEWTSAETDGLSWKVSNGKKSADYNLPNKDHTTKTENGQFMYFGASVSEDRYLSSSLESSFSVKPSSMDTMCQMRFWYQMRSASQLSVFKKYSKNGISKMQLIKQMVVSSDYRWEKETIDFNIDSSEVNIHYQIVLEATLFSPNSTIAVDDISLSPECILSNITDETKDRFSFYCPTGFLSCLDGNCVPWEKVCDFTPDCSNGIDESSCYAKCDFENHTCGWHEKFFDNSFDWIRGSSSNISSDHQNQAPPQDHTTNKTEGHFMFLRKNNNLNSHISELRSPKFSQAASGCTMTFWYYNYGLSVGTAEMHLHVDSEKIPTVVWNTYYDQGNQWLKAFIQLDRLPEPFQLSLAKRNLENYNGVSAIDDVVFENCSLPPPASKCEGPYLFWCKDTKACINSILVCDLIDDCGDWSDEINCPPELQCNFENGLCNWVQDLEDDFDWTVMQGSTPTLDTGPTKDHTLGTAKGHYFYIETSEPQVYRNQAVLLSPTIDSTVNHGNKTCIFRFFYHMHGRQIYSLAVHKRFMQNNRGQLLWQVFGNKGNRWHKKVLFINSSQPFQLLITGTAGDGFTGDIAIDDLSFLNCTLYSGILPTWSPVPVETTKMSTLPVHNCTAEEFVCRTTGQCIPIADLCNFRADCSDNSDEDECVSEYCDFGNKSMCKWFHPGVSVTNKDDTFQWEIGQGSTIHPGEETHRPLKDHTTSSDEGSYLYADSSKGEFGDIAQISTPLISHTGPKCKLAFWSYMNGATVGHLIVLIKIGNLTYELWSQSGRQGAQWRRAEVFLGTLSSFQIVLQAIRGVSYVGDVTVDDVSFEDCAPMMIPDKDCMQGEFMCANKYCIPKNNLCDFVNDCADNSDENPYICGSSFSRCNFEFDLCDWKQNGNDDFDWNLRTGNTPSFGTGPSTDHTLQNPFGYYVFIESSFPHLPRQGAKLSGPMISKWSKECKLIFYFHMYGGGIGSLTVNQVTISNQEQTLLNLTGDQGNYWQRKELMLRDLGEDFYVTFEARIGKDQRGDIALDDIVFSNECLPSASLTFDPQNNPPATDICPQGFLQCSNKKCYSSEKQCDFSDDCGDFTDENECGTSCTFEDGMCGWQNSRADSFDWILGNPAQALRPPKDHTLGNAEGHFLFLEISLVGLKGEKAHIKSSRWKESNANCKLSFWYYMSSKATGLIQVLIKTNNGLSKIWGEVGNSDGTWNRAEIYIGKRRDFEIIFEGIRTRDFGGGAAIDDIEFINCSIFGERPGLCPAETDFVCKNKKCIKYHHVCDYKQDCADLSDENNCGKYNTLSGSCNFEQLDQSGNLTCDLTQDQSDQFDWKLISRITKGINKDHTPGKGKYFLYANSSMQKEGDTARIFTTNPFPATPDHCRVRFWYYIHGSPKSGILKVYLATSYGLNILLWSKTESKTQKWMYASVILSSSSPFRVVFEVLIGSDGFADIAIDDISFTPNCYFEGSTTPHPTCSPDKFPCFIEKRCIPLSAKCDGTEDCVDGSDEINCPTVVPETITSLRCKETEIRCTDRKCIPSMMWCDGVSDCPLDEDEAECGVQPCLDGSLLCVSSNTCIPLHQRCDGTPDCSDFKQDESSCSVCPRGYCKNGGKCFIEKDVPLCKCKKNWKGNRCHLRVTDLPALGTEDNSIVLWISLGTGLAGSLAVIIVAFLCFFYIRKPKTDILKGFSNPIYGEHISTSEKEVTDDALDSNVQISVYPWSTTDQNFMKEPKIFAFTNPLYGKKEIDV